MMSCFTAGKLILAGEHSVVYGETAVVSSVGLGVNVGGRFRKKGVRIVSENGLGRKESSWEEIVAFGNWARMQRERYLQSGNYDELVQVIHRDSLWVPMLALAQVGKGGRLLRGVELVIKSELPVGSGMGSSAAVAAGSIKLASRLLGVSIQQEQLNRMVYEVEQVVHARASGIDNTAVVYGGIIQFKKDEKGFGWTQIEAVSQLPEVLLVQSGIAQETTGEMVAMVAERKKSQPKKYNKLLQRMGEVAEAVAQKVGEGNLDLELMGENQRLLLELGIVGAKAEKMVRIIEQVGGVAKVCGAGGLKEGSGILLVSGRDLDKIQRELEEKSWQHWKTRLGE